MGLLRTLAIIVLAYLGVLLLRRLLRLGAPRRDPAENARTLEGADMVQDPSCGIYVPRDAAVSSQVRDETRYFCSEKCRNEFVKRGKTKK
jgi:YHS domain-containing protein